MTSISTFSESFPGGTLGDWFYSGNTPVYFTGGIQVGGTGSLSTNAFYTFPSGCNVTLKMRADPDGNMAGRFKFMIRDGTTGVIYADVGARDGEIRAIVGEPAPPYPTFTVGQFEWYRIARLTATTWASYTSIDGSTWTQRGTSEQTPTPNAVSVAFSWQFGSVRIGPPIAGAAAAITVTAGPAAETDAAQPIAYLAPVLRTVNATAETDTGQHITYLAPITVTTSPAGESDTAQPIVYTPPPINRPINPAAEADTAQTVPTLLGVLLPLGPAAEADTAWPVGYTPPVLTAELGRVSTHDTAQPMLYSGPPDQVLGVGTATEYDAAVRIVNVLPVLVLADTLLVDGVDLQTLPGVTVTDLSGLFAPGTRRGDDDVIPGRRGQVGAQLPYDAYAFSIPVLLQAARPDGTIAPAARAGRSQFLTNLRALASTLTGTNGLVALTRRLCDDTTDAGYVEHTAAGRFVAGTAFAMLNVSTGRTELQFINLDGAWFNGTDWLVP